MLEIMVNIPVLRSSGLPGIQEGHIVPGPRASPTHSIPHAQGAQTHTQLVHKGMRPHATLWRTTRSLRSQMWHSLYPSNL